MNMPFVEQNCTFKFQDREFTSGGAVVLPDYAIGYLKFDNEFVGSHGIVSTWHGEKLGNAVITAKWKVNSYIGSYMFQVKCVIDNICYTGRSFGNGMIWRGKPKKNQ